MDSPWIFTAFRAPADPGAAPDALQEIRHLRARILFDEGRRPAFRSRAGDHADDQPQDHGAWHFAARRARDGAHGPPLGYVRLLTPVTASLYQSREFLGSTHYEEVLSTEGLNPAAVFEHSRLVVEHRARKLGLGLHLNALAVAAAHELGAAAMIGTSGTADGQDRFHARFGFHPVPGTRRYVEKYTEDVVILLHRTEEGAGEHTALVDEYRLLFRYDLMEDAGLAEPSVPLARSAQSSLSSLSSLSSRSAAKAEPSFTVPDRGPVWRDAPPRRLTAIGPSDPHRWKPVLFEPAQPDARAAMTSLLNTGAVREVLDTVDAQLEELIRARDPGRVFDADALADARSDQLEGARPWAYGTWAWYPWSGRLVHVLPREEFRLVRTDRNRGKIDRPEQRRLLDKRIGVIGLSVGNSAALTLAQEGVAGAFKLADFDTLSVSNLNRLRAGLHQIGVNKAVLAARQMFEIDPYLDIEIFPAGLTEDTVREFFLGGHGPIDLLVEECDTPWVKLAAREAARDLGVPVVMDANDRGLLDIERFDREPHRPLLHGLLGALTPDDCLDLTFAERVDLILAMVDADRVSPALAASIPEIGRTLSSWPQLASGVALGGALVTEAARRILLGSPCPSGRFYVDLEELIRADKNVVGATDSPGGTASGDPGPDPDPDPAQAAVSLPSAP
ncbi:UBA/THIF-type NAD/FAD binding protein [Catenulispora acidiphila DSM 44928]|uniref:UBA/THIF-type NAD/FAD binding protein n=1 Tax=Catenulispora acidiphila (strain DSM 44928 / JCM 14897 / NBRC 102108 / NRRL B-24433 / ID139908) TaxID=479433 RepID=C7PXF2_CATAD|nr:ThiF family adenylyltransferase [Catenulispora acidiphila]ACU69503.1 UBA/THIF-type NAD/FAD binding protein [Catenulispora acidiphila DSM 44928]